MAKYLHLFNNENDYNTARNNNYIEPWVSATNTGNDNYRTDYNKIPINYSSIPLTFEFTKAQSSNILWKKSTNADILPLTIEYKINEGEWTSITSSTGGTAIPNTFNSGDTIQFRGDNDAYSYSGGVGNFLYRTGSIKVNIYGNIMSLINSTGFTTATTLTKDYCFSMFFTNSGPFLSAENLVLPATTLTPYCYAGLFMGTSGMKYGPKILPATTLAQGCYSKMFWQITAFETAPKLPATTLAPYCYESMFRQTKLETAPELPTATLVESCYQNMFAGCGQITYVKCLATDISATNCTSNWLTPYDPGTFVKAASMNNWPTGASGIPEGWTVENAS